MIREHVLNEKIWIDLERPTREEVLSLVEQYRVPVSCAEELLHPSVRSKVDAYPEMLYLVLHFPHAHGTNVAEREIDFVIGRDFLITARYSPNETINRWAETFDLRSVATPDQEIHGGHLFYWILRALYRSLFEELESMGKRIRKIEHKIFDGHESPMVIEISHANRLLLDLKQPLGFHRDILRSFETQSIELFGKEFMPYGHLLLSEHYRVEWMLSSARDTLHDLRDTNDSLLQSKNNDIIQKLTLMSFVTFPLSLIAAVFGMNAQLPFVDSPRAFWGIFGLMLVSAFGMFAYFKSKKWL